jgi:hypothetical protein
MAIAYILISLGIAVVTAFSAGIGPAFCLFGTAILSAFAGGGLKVGIFYKERGSLIICLILLPIIYWLSGDFSISVLGTTLSGQVWAFLGLLLGAILPTPPHFKHRLSLQRGRPS